jgi:eukaryotic-like serine/threonine-protein kinase
MTSPRLAEETGRVLGGRYRLMAPVGVGTSSRVFLAVDTQLRRRVAVKLLHEALAEDDAFLRRFRAEARAAGALSHPNIVAVFDWGEDRAEDGTVVPFLVTEYLGGGSLRDVLDRGAPLSSSQAIVVGLDAARALGHAHLRGLVHRDVKPGNLLFDEEGRLRLADFGLARALAEASWTEPSGVTVGTARYASPEQSLGRRLDGRSDVYSLALVLVECVSGRVPFVGETTTSTLAMRTQGDLELGAELGPLRSVLERAGRLDPELRPEAAEFEIALMAAAEGLPRPDPLPIVPTLGEGEETSELYLVREIDVVRPFEDSGEGAEGPAGVPSGNGAAVATRSWSEPVDADGSDPVVVPDPDPVVISDEELVASGRNPIVVAEEHELLSGARPASFGKVDPFVPTAGSGGEVAGDGAGTRKRRWPRRLLAVLAVVLLLSSAGAAWWYLVRVPVHDVPELVGVEVDRARALAAEFDWEVDASTLDRRDGTEPGEVLAQSPAPGAALAEGGTLRLTVSLGATLTAFPDVVGRPEGEARATLEEVGLVVAPVTRAHDEDVPVDTVVSTALPEGVEPESDGRIARGTPIGLVVSDGPAPRAVPEGLVGAARADAVAALEAVQLDATVREDHSETVPAGVVISADTAAGEEVERGATVGLVVSIGPAPIAVPDVLWISGAMAADQLEKAGFTVAGIEGSPSGMVLATDPVAGELHQRGTAVRVFTRS